MSLTDPVNFPSINRGNLSHTLWKFDHPVGTGTVETTSLHDPAEGFIKKGKSQSQTIFSLFGSQ